MPIPHPEVRKAKIDKVVQKPVVPFLEDRPIMGLRTSKNFLTANAVEVILSAPQTVSGDNTSFMGKDGYGKVPEYLCRVKGEISEENGMIDQYLRQQLGRRSEPVPEYEEMDENERHGIVEQLKNRWDHVNSKYQKMCHRVTIETLGDVKRKEAQENELKQLEDDIEKLSKTGPVMIRKQ